MSDTFGTLRDQRFAYISEKEILDIRFIQDGDLLAVLDYWNETRGPRIAPTVREFRLERLPSDIIPCTAVVDFVGERPDFRYRFFGSYMVEIAGEELTGKSYYADNVKSFGFVNAEIFPLMIEERTPLYTRTRWVSVNGLKFTTSTLRLPLSDDGQAITGGVALDRFQRGHG